MQIADLSEQLLIQTTVAEQLKVQCLFPMMLYVHACKLCILWLYSSRSLCAPDTTLWEYSKLYVMYLTSKFQFI